MYNPNLNFFFSDSGAYVCPISTFGMGDGANFRARHLLAIFFIPYYLNTSSTPHCFHLHLGLALLLARSYGDSRAIFGGEGMYFPFVNIT